MLGRQVTRLATSFPGQILLLLQLTLCRSQLNSTPGGAYWGHFNRRMEEALALSSLLHLRAWLKEGHLLVLHILRPGSEERGLQS